MDSYPTINGPPPVVAARLPSGSPPKWSAFRPLAGVRGCRPEAVGVPSEEGCRRDCWRGCRGCCLAAFGCSTEVERRLAAGWPPGARGVGARACCCPPPRGWLAGPGTLFRGPPPSEEGVAARTRSPPAAEAPVGCRPVAAGLRGGRCCRAAGHRRAWSPRRAMSAGVCRGSPAFRGRWVHVWWAVSLAVLPPRRAETRRFGCGPAPGGQSPFGLRWPFREAEAPCPVRCGRSVRLGPPRSSKLVRFGPPLPSSGIPKNPGAWVRPLPGRGRAGDGESPLPAWQARLVSGLPSARAGEPAFAVGEVAAACAPAAEALGLLPWRRDRRPSKEFIHVKERSVKNVGR
mgnify:CR=1 FL=1